MLDPNERLLVIGVSPPIFRSQHCFRFRNRMQLNMDGLRLNTLYNVPYLAKLNQVNKYTHQNRLASSTRTPPAQDI